MLVTIPIFQRLHSYLIATLFIMATPCGADTIWLNNGDRITGDIEALTKNTLTVKTTDAATLHIKSDAIRTFETSKPKPVHYRELTQLLLITASSTPGFVVIDNHTIAISELAHHQSDKPERAWQKSGRIESALSIDKDTTEREKLHLGANVVVESKRWRHKLRSELRKEKENEYQKEDTVEMGYTLDHFFHRHWLVRGEGFYRENNLSGGIQYHYTGIGPGYRLLGESRNHLDFIATYNRVWLSADVIDTEFDAWTITLEHKHLWLKDKIETFANTQITYPSFEAIESITRASAGLNYFVSPRIYFALRYNHNKTEYNTGSFTDRSYNMGIGVNF